MNIYEKLQKIQAELKAPKNQYNSFGKYKYRSLEDILEGLKPLMNECKVALTITDGVEFIGDRYYIVATATLIDTEKPQEKVEVQARAREDASKKGMDTSQLTGSTSSYARKYALNGLFAIDDNKDSDTTNPNGTDKLTTTDNTKIDKAKADTLNSLAETKKVDIPTMLKYYKVTKVEDMTVQQWQHAMSYLKSK